MAVEPLDLLQLRYFHAIARTGSLTKAAQSMKASQPTLTVALRNLEERLATTLFLRDRRGMVLTETGTILLDHALAAFALLDNVQAEIADLQPGLTGRIVLGCNGSLGSYFLPAVLQHLGGCAPDVEVVLRNASSEVVRQAVLEREVGFGIVVNPHPHADLVIERLFADAVDVVIAAEPAPQPPLTPRARRAAALARLAAGPIIYAERLPQSREILDRLAGDGILGVREIVCGDLEQVKSLALGGIGIALLPRRVAAYGAEDGLVRLHEFLPAIPDTIALVYRTDLPQTRATGAVRDALRSVGRAFAEPLLGVWRKSRAAR